MYVDISPVSRHRNGVDDCVILDEVLEIVYHPIYQKIERQVSTLSRARSVAVDVSRNGLLVIVAALEKNRRDFVVGHSGEICEGMNSSDAGVSFLVSCRQRTRGSVIVARKVQSTVSF